MLTTYICPPECLSHRVAEHHPECSDRLNAINDHLVRTGLDALLRWQDARPASDDDILRVHSKEYLDRIARALPAQGTNLFDGEVSISRESFDAARYAAGAVVTAVDDITNQKSRIVFCAVRPPGHHAKEAEAMGFCLINNVAIGAKYALDVAGFSRVAIVDFDVHHGNGTQSTAEKDARILFCSSFQHPFYPYTEVDVTTPNVINTKLAPATRSATFRQAIEKDWLPALERFKPQIIFVSAGFDAYIHDEMSSICLVEQDYYWLGKLLRDYQDASTKLAPSEHCHGIIASLEGGYDLESLGRCVAAHIKGLTRL